MFNCECCNKSITTKQNYIYHIKTRKHLENEMKQNQEKGIDFMDIINNLSREFSEYKKNQEKSYEKLSNEFNDYKNKTDKKIQSLEEQLSIKKLDTKIAKENVKEMRKDLNTFLKESKQRFIRLKEMEIRFMYLDEVMIRELHPYRMTLRQLRQVNRKGDPIPYRDILEKNIIDTSVYIPPQRKNMVIEEEQPTEVNDIKHDVNTQPVEIQEEPKEEIVEIQEEPIEEQQEEEEEVQEEPEEEDETVEIQEEPIYIKKTETTKETLKDLREIDFSVFQNPNNKIACLFKHVEQKGYQLNQHMETIYNNILRDIVKIDELFICYKDDNDYDEFYCNLDNNINNISYKKLTSYIMTIIVKVNNNFNAYIKNYDYNSDTYLYDSINGLIELYNECNNDIKYMFVSSIIDNLIPCKKQVRILN